MHRAAEAAAYAARERQRESDLSFLWSLHRELGESSRSAHLVPGAIPASQFYNTIDAMIHKTGGSRENYPRVLLEAWAHGVVPIVEHDYAFPELVIHGETGFPSSGSDEMSYHASTLSHESQGTSTISRERKTALGSETS